MESLPEDFGYFCRKYLDLKDQKKEIDRDMRDCLDYIKSSLDDLSEEFEFVVDEIKIASVKTTSTRLIGLKDAKEILGDIVDKITTTNITSRLNIEETLTIETPITMDDLTDAPEWAKVGLKGASGDEMSI